MHILIHYFLIFISSSHPSSNEVQYFDIVHRDKIIGELKATKQQENDRITYKNFTNIKTHIIKDITVAYEYEVVFQSNGLLNANATILVDKKIHKQTITEWTGEAYRIQQNKKREKFLHDTISYSAIMLLFNEPVGKESVFSEETGDLHPLRPLGKQAYQKTNTKGKENRYYYSEGKLDSAQVDAGVIQFELKRRTS